VTEGEHRAARERLGALALGQLSAADDASLRSHVAGCAACRDELAAIEPVVRQLELLSPAAIDAPARPPAALVDLVARSVDAERTARRRRAFARTGLVAAAAAVAAATVSALVVRGLVVSGLEPTATLEPVGVTVASAGVTADADLVAHTWGVEIKLTATGLDAGGVYRVAVLKADGVKRSAGEFVGTGAAPMHCNLNSGVLRRDAEGFVVVDDTGREVLAADFP